MRKTRIAICALLLLFSLVVSLSAEIQGWHISTTWGSRYSQTGSEIAEMAFTCDYVTTVCFLSQQTWGGQNAFASYGLTTGINVYNIASYCENNPNYDFVATLHIGHMVPILVPGGYWAFDQWGNPYWVYLGTTRHYGYYGDNWDQNQAYSLRVQDSVLYWYTYLKHRFTFIWTCVNADLMDTNGDGVGDAYGFYDYANNTAAVGIPYAWTRTTSMSQNGYSNPDGSNRCYIGFENQSKALSESSEFYPETYGVFLRWFYYYAADQHYTINQALNAATVAASNQAMDFFWETDLYDGYIVSQSGIDWKCKMRVYGNGNMVLPY